MAVYSVARVNWALLAIIPCVFIPMHDYNAAVCRDFGAAYADPLGGTTPWDADAVAVCSSPVGNARVSYGLPFIFSVLSFFFGFFGLYTKMHMVTVFYYAVTTGHALYSLLPTLLILASGGAQSDSIRTLALYHRVVLTVIDVIAAIGLHIAASWLRHVNPSPIVRSHEYARLDGLAVLAIAPIVFAAYTIVAVWEVGNMNNPWALLGLLVCGIIIIMVMWWRNSRSIIVAALGSALIMYYGWTRLFWKSPNVAPQPIFGAMGALRGNVNFYAALIQATGVLACVVLWWLTVDGPKDVAEAWKKASHEAMYARLPDWMAGTHKRNVIINNGANGDAGEKAEEGTVTASPTTDIATDRAEPFPEQPFSPVNLSRLVIILWGIQTVYWTVLYIWGGDDSMLFLDGTAFIALLVAIAIHHNRLAAVCASWSLARVIIVTWAMNIGQAKAAGNVLWNGNFNQWLVTVQGMATLATLAWLHFGHKTKEPLTFLGVVDSLAGITTRSMIYTSLIVGLHFVWAPTLLNLEPIHSVTASTIAVGATVVVTVLGFPEPSTLVSTAFGTIFPMYFIANIAFESKAYDNFGHQRVDQGLLTFNVIGLFSCLVFAVTQHILHRRALSDAAASDSSAKGVSVAEERQATADGTAVLAVLISALNVALMFGGVFSTWYMAWTPAGAPIPSVITETIWLPTLHRGVTANYFDGPNSSKDTNAFYRDRNLPDLTPLYRVVSGLITVGIILSGFMLLFSLLRVYLTRRQERARTLGYPLAVVSAIFFFVIAFIVMFATVWFSARHEQAFQSDWTNDCAQWNFTDCTPLAGLRGFPMLGPFFSYFAATFAVLGMLLEIFALKSFANLIKLNRNDKTASQTDHNNLPLESQADNKA